VRRELVTGRLERLIGSGIVSRFRCEWERGQMERRMEGRAKEVPRWNGQVAEVGKEVVRGQRSVQKRYKRPRT
jgi:hypothetical protein